MNYRWHLYKQIQKSIRTVSDFPIEGINFKDITSILLDPKLTNLIIEEFVKRIKLLKIDAIVGVESRGFLFGFMLANKLNIEESIYLSNYFLIFYVSIMISISYFSFRVYEKPLNILTTEHFIIQNGMAITHTNNVQL